MKIGVFTTLFSQMSLEEMLKTVTGLGAKMVEIGCGGYPGRAHADPEILLNQPDKLQEFKDTIEKYQVEISALSCHANPIHPNKEFAQKQDRELRNTVLLAEKLGISIVNTFSGCPGDSPDSHYPNWVTCAWPPDYQKILTYQWEECLIPYWQEFSDFSVNHGVDKIAFELHPGFMLYNTSSLLRLREAVGKTMGANLDPSHLIWQGMDPVLVIRELGEAVFHFHAKDTKIDPYNTAKNGVLDVTSLGEGSSRSWQFRTVGYGNDQLYWNGIISELRAVGYDHAISIEHEDAMMSDLEGLSKAISFLENVVIKTQPTEVFWA